MADTPTGSECPKMLQPRGVHEVMTAQITLFKGGPQALACNYGDDAVVVLPGVVAAGRPQIEAAYMSLFEAFGGSVSIEVNSLTETDSVALMDYSIVSGNEVVLRAVDTFVVQDGLVKVQSHAAGASFPTTSLPHRYRE